MLPRWLYPLCYAKAVSRRKTPPSSSRLPAHHAEIDLRSTAAEILVIGSVALASDVLDTKGHGLARRLATRGIKATRIRAIPDGAGSISQASRYDVTRSPSQTC